MATFPVQNITSARAQNPVSAGGRAIVIFLAKAFQSDTRPTSEARTLRETGHTIFVLAWDRYCEFQANENVEGAIVRSFHHVNLKKSSRFGLVLGAAIFQVLLFLGTVRLIAKIAQRPIVHAHDFNTLLPSCLLKALGLTSGLVYDYRELSYAIYGEWFNPLIAHVVRVIEERFVRYPDEIITVCDPIAGYLRKFNRATEIVYNCPRRVDIPDLSRNEARVKLGLPVDAFIVSFIGEIRYDCRLDLMLSTASLVNRENIHFLVVGGGPLASQFRELALASQVPRVTVLPRVPRESALLYLKASDLTWIIYQRPALSLNSRIGLPWKLFESLACGVPPIVDRDTLRATLVNRLRCGVVLEKDTPDYISRTIVSLAENSDQYRSMSVAARRAARDFSWEKMSRKLVDVYSRFSPVRDKDD